MFVLVVMVDDLATLQWTAKFLFGDDAMRVSPVQFRIGSWQQPSIWRRSLASQGVATLHGRPASFRPIPTHHRAEFRVRAGRLSLEWFAAFAACQVLASGRITLFGRRTIARM